MNKQNLTELMLCAYGQGYTSLWSKVFNGNVFSVRTFLILKDIAGTY